MYHCYLSLPLLYVVLLCVITCDYVMCDCACACVMIPGWHSYHGEIRQGASPQPRGGTQATVASWGPTEEG